MTPFPIAQAKQARVLVIGDIMVDRYWFGSADRISPEAPVPVVKVGHKEDRLGGAANVARNVASLGANVTLLGVVGTDDTADALKLLLKEAAVTPQLVQDSIMPTTLKLRVLGRQQQLLRMDFEELPSDESLQHLNSRADQLIASHHLVILSDYAKGTLAQVGALIALAREHGVPVLVDPKGDNYQRYQGASSITPNRLEMEQAVGKWNSEAELQAKAESLRTALGLEALLITRSEQGMTIFTEHGRTHTDAQAQEVFDVSGAGDTVLATLAVARAAGLSWEDAMRWANIAGGVVVGKLGTSVVTLEELQ